MSSPVQQVIDAVWRMESARLIAGLARVVGDVGLAEDLAQDALVAALEQWPESGVPQVPGAWLMALARRRGVDTIRRAVTLRNKVELLGRELSDQQSPRVALTLKMVAGLSTQQIARAFLVQKTTMAARITRAKKTLTEASVPFEVPVGEELTDRLDCVLEAVYLIFNEGYTATAGEQWARAELCHEAIRLGRMLAALAPGDAQTHALVALMEIQAKIAACHARAARAADTDWVRIASLYGDLLALTRSPIVELNRAVAVSMAHGPAAGLAVTDALLDVAVLRTYHLLPSVRGDEARAEFERAAGLTSNQAERAHLLTRASST